MSRAPLRTCANMSGSEPSWLLGRMRTSTWASVVLRTAAAASCCRTFIGCMIVCAWPSLRENCAARARRMLTSGNAAPSPAAVTTILRRVVIMGD